MTIKKPATILEVEKLRETIPEMDCLPVFTEKWKAFIKDLSPEEISLVTWHLSCREFERGFYRGKHEDYEA